MLNTEMSGDVRARRVNPARAALAAFAVLAVTASALADDLRPPPWPRTAPGATFQCWQWTTPLMPSPPDCPNCPPNNQFGIASADVTGGMYIPNFLGLPGINAWCLAVGDSIRVEVPNAESPPPDIKTVWIQVTFHKHAGTDDLVMNMTAPFGAAVAISPPVDSPVPPFQNNPNWIHRTWAICWSPCPGLERIDLQAVGGPGGHIDITQVVVDSMCDGMCWPPPSPPVAPDDQDGDGVDDISDNCPAIPNGAQIDSDGDGIGDECDEPCANPPCPGDIDGDGDTDLADLGALLSNFGCVGPGCVGDLDGDGDVDLGDLGALLADYGCT